MSEVGDEIRQAREARGLSRPALARKLGETVKTLQRIETGETRTSSKIDKVQAYLKVGPYKPDGSTPQESEAPRRPGDMTSPELAARYWELTNELRQVAAELSEVGAVMAQRLPPERSGRNPVDAPYVSTEFAGPAMPPVQRRDIEAG